MGAKNNNDNKDDNDNDNNNNNTQRALCREALPDSTRHIPDHNPAFSTPEINRNNKRHCQLTASDSVFQCHSTHTNKLRLLLYDATWGHFIFP